MQRGKGTKKGIKGDKTNLYDVKEGMDLVAENARQKFDETVRYTSDWAFPEDTINKERSHRSSHGIGKETRVLVFAKGLRQWRRKKRSDLRGRGNGIEDSDGKLVRI